MCTLSLVYATQLLTNKSLAYFCDYHHFEKHLQILGEKEKGGERGWERHIREGGKGPSLPLQGKRGLERKSTSLFDN